MFTNYFKIGFKEKRILFVKNKSDHVDFGAASSFVAPKKDQPGFAVRYLNDVTEEPIYSVPSRPKPCIAESGVFLVNFSIVCCNWKMGHFAKMQMNVCCMDLCSSFKNDKQYITEVLGIKSQSRSKINGVNHEEKTDLQNEEIINDSSVLQNNAEMLREIEEKDGPASTKCDDSDNSCERDYGYYSQFHNDDDLNRRIMASTLWKAIDKAKMTQYV